MYFILKNEQNEIVHYRSRLTDLKRDCLQNKFDLSKMTIEKTENEISCEEGRLFLINDRLNETNEE